MTTEHTTVSGLYLGKSPKWFLYRFAILALLATVASVCSVEFQKYFGLEWLPKFIGSEFIPAVCGIAALLFGAAPILRSGIKAIVSLKPNADSQISLVVLVSLGYSLVQTVANQFLTLIDPRQYWWQLCLMIAIVLFGRWLELSLILRATEQRGVSDSSLAEPDSTNRGRLATELAPWFFYASVIVAFIHVIVLGPLTSPASNSNSLITSGFIFERTLTSLAIISILPLILSIRLPAMAGLLAATDLGVAVFESAKFALAGKSDVVVFGKSGTLTTGKRKFFAARLANGNPLSDVDELLALAAGIEQDSDHPIARAILDEAKKRKLEPVQVRDRMVMPGQGISARIDGFRFFIGAPSLLTQNNIRIEVGDLVLADQANTEGRTVVYLVRDGILLGTIEFTHEARKSAKNAVLELRYQRRRVVLLTSEASGVTKALAKELGIEEYFAEVLPHQKSLLIEKLQSDGSIITMVGDLAEESQALGQADVAISFNAGKGAKNYNSGEVKAPHLGVASADLEMIGEILKLSSRTSRIQIENFAWAAGYNLLFLVLCAAALFGLDFVVSPLLATLLMSLATVIVAANTLRLRRR
jgi:Cu2+-exporting ATPase